MPIVQWMTSYFQRTSRFYEEKQPEYIQLLSNKTIWHCLIGYSNTNCTQGKRVWFLWWQPYQLHQTNFALPLQIAPIKSLTMFSITISPTANAVCTFFFSSSSFFFFSSFLIFIFVLVFLLIFIIFIFIFALCSN